jgi:hypothetical protein
MHGAIIALLSIAIKAHLVVAEAILVVTIALFVFC